MLRVGKRKKGVGVEGGIGDGPSTCEILPLRSDPVRVLFSS